MSADSNLEADLKRALDDQIGRIDALRAPLSIEQKKSRFEEIDELMQAPEFWNDQATATALQKERNSIESVIRRFEAADQQAGDGKELLEMAEGDEDTLLELKEEVDAIEKMVSQMELERMLSGPNDTNSAFVNINSGAGGVDAMDFAEMLVRMYKRYGERRGYKVELLEASAGEEAGLKSATLRIDGEYAFGYLKAEIGVHRLVRISPFDANARRQTSFASVWVTPEIDDDIDIEIKKEDLRVDTYRAGGAGGQHVNKTDSAVRFTHVPTGIVVACQAERSQQKNRVTAMKMLKSRLYEHEMQQRLAERDSAEAAKMENSFGSQIRNYVIHPYRLAKDLRSGFESGNVDAVLDGELQAFIEAYLMSDNNQVAE